MAEVEEQIAEEFCEDNNPQKSPNTLIDDSLPPVAFNRRHLSSSSMKHRDHKVARHTLSLRSDRDSFKSRGSFKSRDNSKTSSKPNLVSHDSPGGREIIPLTTLSSKDEDSTPLEMSNSCSSGDETSEK